MSEKPQTKLVVIHDIGRTLNPIGWGFKSPVLTPFRLPLEKIARLLTESGVTRMFEVYEKDETMLVPLNITNFRKPFIEIWKELNPGKEFPWEREVVRVETTQPKSESETPPTTHPPQGDTGKQDEPTTPSETVTADETTTPNEPGQTPVTNADNDDESGEKDKPQESTPEGGLETSDAQSTVVSEKSDDENGGSLDQGNTTAKEGGTTDETSKNATSVKAGPQNNYHKRYGSNKKR